MEGILIHERDQVVTVTSSAKKGDIIRYKTQKGTMELSVREDVPCYYKIAREEIALGDEVFKYGEVIGVAVKGIRSGSVVHQYNLSSKK